MGFNSGFKGLNFLNITFNEFLEIREVRNKLASFDLHWSACQVRQLAISLLVLEAFCASSHIDSSGYLVLQPAHMAVTYSRVCVLQCWAGDTLSSRHVSSHITYVLFSTPSLSLPMRWLSHADLYNLLTWCHIKRSVGALFQKTFPPFLETTGNVWRALDKYVTSHEMCATAEIWETRWQVSRPELHARSRDVSRATEVWTAR